MSSVDKVFTGAIPALYDEYLVPLIFEAYALDLAKRVAAIAPARVLELAAGTGVVTRALDAALAPAAAIVASDLNPTMIERAKAVGTRRAVDWRVVDAMSLPFEAGEFDAVMCQFGVMFFPDKPKAFAEAKRVLRPGGTFFFNVWDRIEENEFANAILEALAEVFPADPPRFMARTPHGYHDKQAIVRDLAAGGFTATPVIETVEARSRAASPRVPAVAYCQGTPWRNEIEARGDPGLGAATDAAERAIARRFGSGAVDGRIVAHVITVRR